jgi:hypothetical protein
MGAIPSKIKDEQRIKIYKRVKLEDAREKYEQLSEEVKLYSPFLDTPVSRNFAMFYESLIDLGENKYNNIRLRRFESEDNRNYNYLEVDGDQSYYGQKVPLYLLLRNTVTYYYHNSSREKPPGSFLIGLSKPQHDLLFSPSAFLTKVKAEQKGSEKLEINEIKLKQNLEVKLPSKAETEQKLQDISKEVKKF